jgi:hypothetical protein
MLPVLFRHEPVVPVDRTAVGIGIHRRKPLRHRRLDLFWQLKAGPFLAAFNAGLEGEYVVGASRWRRAR